MFNESGAGLGDYNPDSIIKEGWVLPKKTRERDKLVNWEAKIVGDVCAERTPTFLTIENKLLSSDQEIIQRIQQCYEECNTKGWDEDTASPITSATLLAAKKIPSYLSSRLLNKAEIYGEPVDIDEGNSGISFEWCKQRGEVFVITVFGEPHELVTYSGFFGSLDSRTSGREPLHKVNMLHHFIERIV